MRLNQLGRSGSIPMLRMRACHLGAREPAMVTDCPSGREPRDRLLRRPDLVEQAKWQLGQLQ